MNLQLPAFFLFETNFANFFSEMLSGVYAGVIFLSSIFLSNVFYPTLIILYMYIHSYININNMFY